MSRRQYTGGKGKKPSVRPPRFEKRYLVAVVCENCGAIYDCRMRSAWRRWWHERWPLDKRS